MNSAKTGLFGFSHIEVTALLSVAVLIGSIFWNSFQKSTASPPVFSQKQTASSTDSTDYVAVLSGGTPAADSGASPLSPLGQSIMNNVVATYAVASKGGVSDSEGITAVENIAQKIIPALTYRTYSASDIKTDPDTSRDRVISYRADLRTALEPLFQNKEFELDIFAHYIDTGNAKYLNDLRTAAVNYRNAVANAEKMAVPADAASYHAAILNSLGQFAATLDAMAESAQDPIASATLLTSYTSSQNGMLLAFNAIGAYAAQKIL